MTRNKKKSFVLYDDYYEHVALLSVEEKALLLDAIFAKRMGTAVPELPPMAKMAFSFIGAQLDRDRERYDETCKKRKEYGKLGGRPKKNNSEEQNQKNTKPHSKTKRNHKLLKKADNDTDNDTDTDTDNDTDTEYNSGAKAPLNARAKAQRIPPTLEEVQTYCIERGNHVDPERFYDHYSANGWKVGLSAMKDWRAAVRNWERSEKGHYTVGKQRGDPFMEYMREELAKEEAKERGELI